jgi:hypothetical protein
MQNLSGRDTKHSPLLKLYLFPNISTPDFYLKMTTFGDVEEKLTLQISVSIMGTSKNSKSHWTRYAISIAMTGLPLTYRGKTDNFRGALMPI